MDIDVSKYLGLADFLASLATLIALAVVVIELRLTRKTNDRQAAYDIVFQWNELQESLVDLGYINFKDFDDYSRQVYEDKVLRGAVGRLLNYYEWMGQLVYMDVMEMDTAIGHAGGMAINHWEKYKDVIKGLRQLRNNDTSFGFFEWFALSAGEKKPKLDQILLKDLDRLRTED